MKIKKIKISGFRGVKNIIELDLPSGFVVICGSNGSGKSTICDSIEYALTGEIRESSKHTEKGESVMDYLWWRGKGKPKDRYVEIIFGDNNGEEINIIRKSDGILSLNEEKIRNALCAKRHAPMDFQKELVRTSILRDEEITELSVDLSERERFEFALNAVGTADLQLLEKKAGDLCEKAKKEKESRRNEYDNIRNYISDISARVSEARVEASGYENSSIAESYLKKLLNLPNSNIEKLLEAARSRVANLRLKIAKLEDFLIEIRKFNVKKTSIESTDFVAITKKLEEGNNKLEKEIASLKKEHDSLNEILSLSEKSKSYNKALAGLISCGQIVGLDNGKCPLCGSIIAQSDFEKHLKTIEKRISKKERDLALKEKERIRIEQRIIELERNLKRLKEQLAIRQQEILNLNEKLEDLATKARSLEIEFADKSQLSEENVEEEIEKTRKQIEMVEKNLLILEASKAHERVLNLERELQETKNKVEAIDSELRQATEIENKAKSSLDIIRRFSGEIVDERLSEISPLLNELFARLRPHIEWHDINYSLRGDVRRFLSLTVGKNLNPSFIFSSGQRRAVGLAFLLAVHLARPWCKLESLILDDPIQHIDDYRALHLAEVLCAIRKSGRQIICTVENQDLALLLCRRLRSLSESEGMLLKIHYQPEEGVSVLSKERIGPMKKKILLAV